MLMVRKGLISAKEVLRLNIVINKDLLEQIGIKFGSGICLNLLCWCGFLRERIEFTDYSRTG